MKRTKDMTEGSSSKNIVLFAVPIFLGTLFQQFYNMTDTIIVGRFLGESALAAVGSTGSIVYLVIGFAGGLTQGCGILIARAFGSKRMEELRHFVALALLVVVYASLLISLPVVLLSRKILVGMNTPADVLDYAHAYLRIVFMGIVCTMSYNMVSSILRAMGDSRTPLYFLILSSFLNIGLDIFFIVIVKLGTAGVALATVLSQGVSAALCLVYMFRTYENLRLRSVDFRADTRTLLRIVRTGIPMALNQSVTALGIMILQSGVNQFGPAIMAAYAAASKVETLVGQPMIALGTAISTYCAQNLGAGKLERIYTGIRKAMLMDVGIASGGLLLYFVMSRFVIDCFITDPSPAAYLYAQQYLHTSGWFLIALAWIFLFRNALVGLGNGMIPMLGGVMELVCRAVCVRTLLEPLGFWCIRLTNPITWIIACVYFAGLYFLWEYRQKRKAGCSGGNFPIFGEVQRWGKRHRANLIRDERI